MLKSRRNLKIAPFDTTPTDIYPIIREYIPAKERKEFDEEVDGIESEKELDEFIFDDIAEFFDDLLKDKRYAFGMHEISEDIGFWIVSGDGDLDVPYEGMVDRSKPDAIKRKADSTIKEPEIITDKETPSKLKRANPKRVGDARTSRVAEEETLEEMLDRHKEEILWLLKEK